MPGRQWHGRAEEETWPVTSWGLGQPDRGALGPSPSCPKSRPSRERSPEAVLLRRQPQVGGWVAGGRAGGRAQAGSVLPAAKAPQEPGRPAAGHPGVQLGTRLERRDLQRVPHRGRAHRGHGPRRPVSWAGGWARRGEAGARRGGLPGRRLTGADPVLGSSALREERLLLTRTGSSSPCLDLRCVAPPPPGPPSPPSPRGSQLCQPQPRAGSRRLFPRAPGRGWAQ